MRQYRSAALLALPLAAGSLAMGAARAGDGTGPAPCSAATLKGTYAMHGTGSYAGQDLRAIQTLTFDGAGKVTGRGTAVFDDVAALVVPFENRDGSYHVDAGCTGTMRWFGHHPTIPVADHVHDAEVLVSGGGRELSLIYTDTEFPNGLPEPVESVTLTGTRM